MLEWSANLPKGCLNKLVEESVVVEVGFSTPEEHRSLLYLSYNCMSGRGRSHGISVVSPVCLPHLHPQVLHLAGHVNFLPGGVTRQKPPRTKGG